MNRQPNAQWQKKYDYMNRVVDHASEILDRPEVMDALGEKGLFLAMTMESVRVRAVKGGEIEWADEDGRTTIHAVALAANESIIIPQTGSNEHQYVFGSMLFGDEEAVRLLIDRDTPISLTMDDDSAGMMSALTRTHAIADRKLHPLQMYVRGRPTIAVKYEEQGSLKLQALTMIHEANHAMGATIYPMCLAKSDDDYYLSSELSAYNSQSIVARAIGVTGDWYLPHRVESIRKQFNGDISSNHAYRTDMGVAKKLDEIGLGNLHD